MSNKGRKAALLAWQGHLSEKAQEFKDFFVFGPAGEVGYREVMDDQERVRYYGFSRPGLLKLLVTIEIMEAKRDREDGEHQRELEYANYSDRVRRGLLSNSRYLAEEKRRLERERECAMWQLFSLQRALAQLDAMAILSPSKVAYLTAGLSSADSERIFFCDQLGVERLTQQIARDQRRQNMLSDLGLIDLPGESSPDDLRFVEVCNNDDMLTLLQYDVPTLLQYAREYAVQAQNPQDNGKLAAAM